MSGYELKPENAATAKKSLLRESIDVTGIDWQLEASTNPAQLPEITRMDLHTSSTASLLSGGVLSPGRRTMKDYEQQQTHLEQENFQLKLRIYMLEERLQQGHSTPDTDSSLIVDLKVQVATQREELAQKKELLRRASDTLESLEQQYGTELERQRRQADSERDRLERRVADLQAELERAGPERAALAERSAVEQPYLRAFEPLAVDHAACHSQHELSQLEARMGELQAALGQMKQTAEERDREADLLRHQLDEALAAAGRLPELEQRSLQLSEEIHQLRLERDRAAAETERLRAEKDRGAAEVELLSEQLRQLQTERDGTTAELTQLRRRLNQAEQSPAVTEELQRTCDQLTAGRTADGARIAEMEAALQRANNRISAAATSEATLSSALHSVGAQLVEKKAELAAAKKAQRRGAAHVQALIEEQRKMHLAMKQHVASGGSGGGAEGPPTDTQTAEGPPTDAAATAADTATAPSDESARAPAPCGAGGGGAAPAPPLTPHEVQVYLLRTETQRKDRRIRGLVAEMKQMNDLLVKYRWEVKELAEEENERLWTELEENKKLIRELQDEKMELVLEKERQIQRLLAQLKERDAGGGPAELHRSVSDASLQEANSQVLSLRSQLAHATLLVGERDSEIGRLRERLLQQRRLLDEPLPAPQLRQRLSQQLGELCAELAAPRPGAPELGGAGEMAADRCQSTARPSEASEPGSEKVVGLRVQLSDLRDQLLVRDQQLAERDRRAADAERLQRALADQERQLRAADVQLRAMAELRETLADRERELTLAEGQLNEIAELRQQLEARDRQLAAGGDQRRELLQTRQLLAERDQEKAALLRHLDQQRRQHESQARTLREQLEAAVTAPTLEQHREAEARHSREQARLRRRLVDTQAAAELLQRRLEQLADFLELLLSLEERGVLDLSCLTAQHMADLQRSLLQSRELSQSLTQSLLLGADGALDGSGCSLDASAAVPAGEQSSLHIPELEPVRGRGSAAVPTLAPRKADWRPSDATEEIKAPGTPPAGGTRSEPSSPDQKPSSPRECKALHQRRSTCTAVSTADRETEPLATPPVTEAEVQGGSAPQSTERGTQATQPAAAPVQTTERAAQTAAEPAQTAERTAQTAGSAVCTAERAVQTDEVAARPAGEAAPLETMAAQLAGRDAQLLQQTQLVAELRRQLQLSAGPPPTELGGGDERTLAALPGDVRDRLRSLVQRQRTSDRASSTDTATAVERALSPILGLARARSTELMGLGYGPQPVASRPSRGSGQLMPPPPPPPPSASAPGSITAPAPVNEEPQVPTSAAAAAAAGVPALAAVSEGQANQTTHHEPHGRPPPVPAPADCSESEAWSEPDRDVSLARIGLDQSSLGTPTESWMAQQSDSDARRSRRRQRAGSNSQQAVQLEAQIESLHQVKDALRAEVDIYQKVLPPAGQGQKHADDDVPAELEGVLVPREVLAEIHSLQQQLERAIAANERIRRQLERELPPHQPDTAAAELARKLQETERRLTDSAEQLTASRTHCDELRAKLSRAKDSLRLAQLNAQQFKDKFVRVSDDMVRLRERFTQLETDRDRTSEESGRRRRHRSPTSDSTRRLERQLQTAHAALRRQEQLSEELRQQLQQQAAPGSCSDTQLLEISREKLRLLGERAQLASRGRLLRSESCLLDGEARQAAAQRRLEAAKWAGWTLERQQLEQRLAAAEAGAAGRLLAETERARLAEEHSHCQRRLAELGRTVQTDRGRLQQVSAQLEEVNAEMDAMRRKLNEPDNDAGQAESGRGGVLPSDNQPEPEPEPEEPVMRRSTSESDGHDVHHESDRTSAYSSPDLGIESDCCPLPVPARPGRQQPTRTEAEKDGGTAEPPPDTSETERLRHERDMMHSKLAATRAALQQALDKLSRADQRKARVERAIYRQLSKTHDILRRAKRNLAPPAERSDGAPR